MKFMWLDYLVYTIDNCVMKLCIEYTTICGCTDAAMVGRHRPCGRAGGRPPSVGRSGLEGQHGHRSATRQSWRWHGLRQYRYSCCRRARCAICDQVPHAGTCQLVSSQAAATRRLAPMFSHCIIEYI